MMREVIAIHSSIWYSNDVGHPSHTQTNNTSNKQSYSINALTIQNSYKPLVVTHMTKYLKNSVGNMERKRFR